MLGCLVIGLPKQAKHVNRFLIFFDFLTMVCIRSGLNALGSMNESSLGEGGFFREFCGFCHPWGEVTPWVRAQFSDRRLPPGPFPPAPTHHTHPTATIGWWHPEFVARAPTPGAGPGTIGPRFRHWLRYRFIAPRPVGISATHTAPQNSPSASGVGGD